MGAQGRVCRAQRREIGAHLRVAPADMTAEDAAKLAKAIADSPRAMTLSEIREMARKKLGRARGQTAYNAIKDKWNDFGLKAIPGPKPSQRFVWRVDK